MPGTRPANTVMPGNRPGIRLRPQFSGRWRHGGTAGDVFELVVSGPQPVHGLRIQCDSVAGWVVLDEDVASGREVTGIRDTRELHSMTLYPGDSVHLKLTLGDADQAELKFFARDAAGWWHGFLLGVRGGHGV